ncbi:HdeD family acid-resistance protein [Eubacterium aggregans]|uniref:HdeD family acid-resistance protein n=1 Tax=Eubacterium aggregans TaxID=81409 RepID=UPI0023F35E74|nr:MFS transporter [Eubacterium aggregans]MDD4692705.1 MFS transporter [Eubacterium aggregans]
MNKLKNYTPVAWIAIAILVFIGGLLLLFNVSLAWQIIEVASAALVCLVGVVYFLSGIIGTAQDRLKTVLLGGVLVVGGIIMFVAPYLVKDIFNLVAGILGMIIGVLVLLNAFKLRSDGAWWLSTLLGGLIYLCLGFVMTQADNQGRLFGIIFGIYLICFSFNIFADAFVALMRNNDGAKKAKKRMRIALPAIFAAFLPMKMLKQVNDLVQEEPGELLMLSEERQHENIVPDMEIYIHTREGLIPGMGHVDIALGDTVYSYGNYDDSTWKMGGFFADGVLVEMSRQDHIDQALDVEKKILMVYGLSLEPEQLAGVKGQIEKIYGDTIPWKPLAQQCEEGEIPGQPEDFKDVSSDLYNATKAKFYKFKKGNAFKTYYAVGTNCVALADTIVGKSGIDILRINGIITPGAYLDYLDALYERGDTIVVTKTLYCMDEDKHVSVQENWKRKTTE